jgi:hypothetical protein
VLELQVWHWKQAKISRPEVKFGQNAAMEVATVTATNSAAKIKRITWKIN